MSQVIAPINFYEDGTRKDGQLEITQTQLVFKSGMFDKTTLAYPIIKQCYQDDAQKIKSQLDIITKTFRKLTVDFSPGQINTVINKISSARVSPTLKSLPAFKVQQPIDKEEWNMFTLEKEYEKLGVPNANWKFTDLNKDFGLCTTYPRNFAVPATARDSVIAGSAKFRSRQRLPVLTYLHNNAGCIVRCAQPMAGANNRSEMDEKYLELCVDTSRSKVNGLIVDTRPMINAMANRAQGKGYENVEHYNKCEFQFLGIENIHVMRKSLERLEMDGWLASDWLKHIYAVLDVSNKVKQAVQEGRTVIVHCSDGWDRTSQVCSGAALMLCPRYRTFEGFLSLINKDWINFGHKCADRLNLSEENDPKEASPIFLQFLEFVYQLIQQYPRAFEFNTSYLVEIYEKVIACNYGDFIGNSIKHREEIGIYTNTKSLLKHLYEIREKFTNHIYEPFNDVLEPEVKMCFVKFWAEMYHAVRSNPVNEAIDRLVQENRSLEETVKMLEEAIKS